MVKSIEWEIRRLLQWSGGDGEGLFPSKGCLSKKSYKKKCQLQQQTSKKRTLLCQENRALWKTVDGQSKSISGADQLILLPSTKIWLKCWKEENQLKSVWNHRQRSCEPIKKIHWTGFTKDKRTLSGFSVRQAFCKTCLKNDHFTGWPYGFRS